MARVKGIFATRLSGSVGKVVFRQVGTVNVASEKPATVTNPKTKAQQEQRMFFNTVIQAYNGLKDLCDHSFENFTGKSANQAEFMRENLILAKSSFDYFLIKGAKAVMPNNYMLSKGSLVSPIVSLTLGSANNIMNMELSYLTPVASEDMATVTVEQFYNALGIPVGSEIAFIISTVAAGDNAFRYNEQLMGYRTITNTFRLTLDASNPEAKVFTVNEGTTSFNSAVLYAEGTNFTPVIRSADENSIELEITLNGISSEHVSDQMVYGVVYSYKDAGKWKRSTSYAKSTAFDMPEKEDVLPSYEPSATLFLNNASK